jgi:LmbE family N-acetylglucosaminyl deacetylase
LCVAVVVAVFSSRSAYAVDCATANAHIPGTNTLFCGYGTRTVVFFAPHPDDETLGMAGAILAAKNSGATVILELMTHGEASAACGSCFDPGFPVCGDQRVHYFTNAAKALNADAIVVNDFGDGQLMVGNSCSGTTIKQQVADRVSFWASQGAVLRGPSGLQDQRCHPDHVAVHLAMERASASDKKYYMIYVHDADNNDYDSGTNTQSPARVSSGQIATEPVDCVCGTGTSDLSETCSTGAHTAAGEHSVMAALDQYPWGFSTGGIFTGAYRECLNRSAGSAREYFDPGPPPASCSAAPPALACGEASCVSPQGAYVSHYTGAGCTGTESYYTPYFTGGTTGVPGNCEPANSTGKSCGTTLKTVTNVSAFVQGSGCSNYWPGGNTLSGFVSVYHCGEASCVSPQGSYVSHFTGPNCTGTESYYTPYFTGGSTGVSGNCQPDNASGVVCGTQLRTVTNVSAIVPGSPCANYWPSGNTLSGFVTVYR